MSLKINLTHLEKGPQNYRGEIPLEALEMDTQDELIHPGSGIEYQLKVERHEQNLLVQGEIRQLFNCECARCLQPFENQAILPKWSQLIPLSGDDAIEINNDCLDLTPYLREDMLLTLPQHPLCAKDCRGMNSSVEKSTVPRTENPEREQTPSAWTALDELRLE